MKKIIKTLIVFVLLFSGSTLYASTNILGVNLGFGVNIVSNQKTSGYYSGYGGYYSNYQRSIFFLVLILA